MLGNSTSNTQDLRNKKFYPLNESPRRKPTRDTLCFFPRYIIVIFSLLRYIFIISYGNSSNGTRKEPGRACYNNNNDNTKYRT